MPTTILVAEDDPSILDVLAAVLEDAGYRVLRARDGAEALVRLDLDRPDLLLTDERMPRLSGSDLVAYLRAHPDIAVPVILLTATPPAAPPPGVAVLSKPFDVARLLAAVALRLPAP
ncbi:MAG TPA: response regulator [Thermomicrobiales bacterium]|nr:response regulator [Thermomicrobiales bacterium]